MIYPQIDCTDYLLEQHYQTIDEDAYFEEVVDRFFESFPERESAEDQAVTWFENQEETVVRGFPTDKEIQEFGERKWEEFFEILKAFPQPATLLRA
jgi:hypothetical protein